MDLIVALIIAVPFCIITQTIVPKMVKLPKRLNPDFYHDEHAFSRYYDILIKGDKDGNLHTGNGGM